MVIAGRMSLLCSYNFSDVNAHFFIILSALFTTESPEKWAAALESRSYCPMNEASFKARIVTICHINAAQILPCLIRSMNHLQSNLSQEDTTKCTDLMDSRALKFDTEGHFSVHSLRVRE